ncbi:MAG: protein phosphatase 2C domain-containing protein [Propionibacteriaceae bacterium]|nr:protein phosphatase 2C domain-containing protein [Propionibacteriaceae bacterium]
MTTFDHDTPGVEWRPDAPEATVPLRPARPRFDAYPDACAACGGELGIDGYCQRCGQKAKSLREHYEMAPARWVGGVCDIGVSHARNEDALACQANDRRAVMVVCDGVTTSDDSDLASMAAAHAACDLAWAQDPQGTGTPSSRAAALKALLTSAMTSANEAVVDCTDPESVNAAATTIAMAIVDDRWILAANLGDSRVYWFPDGADPWQVTRDHSLAQDGMDSGAERAEAESSALAHTITKWLGRDAIDLIPNMGVVEISRPGWVIVCSDGLWNYASEAVDLAAVVALCVAEDTTALELASRLVDWANAQGGHDNVTVACARVDPASAEC